MYESLVTKKDDRKEKHVMQSLHLLVKMICVSTHLYWR